MGVLTLAMGQGVLTASLGPELPCSGHLARGSLGSQLFYL